VGSVELGLVLTSFFGHVEKNKKKENNKRERERENLDCKINMFFLVLPFAHSLELMGQLTQFLYIY